jgi:hypothetical protein
VSSSDRSKLRGTARLPANSATGIRALVRYPQLDFRIAYVRLGVLT